MATKNGKRSQRRLQEIGHMYMKETGQTNLDPDDVAKWAIKKGLWHFAPLDPARQLRQLLTRAWAAEYEIDPQGREVRSMIPIPIGSENGQLHWAWCPIFQAKKQQFQLSQQVRRNGILAGCKQHKRDTDSYNDNNVHGAYVDLFDYNFNQDLEEDQFPTEYPDEPPTDDHKND